MVDLAKRGWLSRDVARRIAPGNPRRQKAIRQEFRAAVAETEVLKNQAVAAGNGAVFEEWPDIVDALIRRAMRGRVDAAKFLAEITGIHNPRVDHLHKGDVKLTLVSMPRPEASGNGPRQLPEDVIEGTVDE